MAASLILALGAAGCAGGSSGGGAAQDGDSTTTYTNETFRFSITHDTLLTQGEPGGPGDSKAAFAVAFVDTGGPAAGGSYVDGVQVAVFELARAVKPSEVGGLKTQVEPVVAERLAELPSGEVTEPVSKTTVNGTPGFTVSYTFSRGGVPVSAVSSFLFSGQYQYEVTGQASRADWTKLQPVLEAAMASFTVL
jgi:hypothetical protein